MQVDDDKLYNDDNRDHATFEHILWTDKPVPLEEFRSEKLKQKGKCLPKHEIEDAFQGEGGLWHVRVRYNTKRTLEGITKYYDNTKTVHKRVDTFERSPMSWALKKARVESFSNSASASSSNSATPGKQEEASRKAFRSFRDDLQQIATEQCLKEWINDLEKGVTFSELKRKAKEDDKDLIFYLNTDLLLEVAIEVQQYKYCEENSAIYIEKLKAGIDFVQLINTTNKYEKLYLMQNQEHLMKAANMR